MKCIVFRIDMYAVCGKCGFEDKEGKYSPAHAPTVHSQVRRELCPQCGTRSWVPRNSFDSDVDFEERLRRWGYKK